ncbi:hypothetical protein B0H13DRAFT_2673020 [Mycena leptocephala]|nr:hypothetical protein B0H13DRAFT_2673020 [Mycena leptocephala]
MHPYGEFVRDQPRFLELLTRRAGGVFIFARLAVRFLDTYRDHPNPQEQFELLLSSGGEGLSPLDDLYLQILRSAFPPNAFRASHLLSFLTIVALQKHPLTPQVMALFESELSTNEIVWMSDRLRSALLMDNEGCVVPLHATFREFLLDPKRCIDPLYHINKSKGKAQLASACMAAFTFENMLVYLAGNTDAPVWHYINHLRGCWSYYLVGAEFNKQLKQQFMHFLSSQIPVHMRIYTLRLVESIICEHMVQWFEGSRDSDATHLISEWTKFAAYSKLWWTRALESPNLRTDVGVVSPDINVADIASRPESMFDHYDEALGTISTTDIARYQAAHEELLEQIRGARLQEVWFDPERAYV